MLRIPAPLRVRDFRLFWSGQAVSALGDQFALVALPWLALVMTGSPVALAGILAAMAIPRAVLMLVGGVYVDRLSPRRVMLVTSWVRLTAMTTLAFIVIAGAASLPILYLFAVVFGIADAFFFPAQQAILPMLVESDQLPAANVLVQGTTQATVLVGPVIAGALIAMLGSGESGPSPVGIGVALLVDALSFVASVATLATLRRGSSPRAVDEPVTRAMRHAIAFTWRWPSLRFVVLFAMAVNLLVVGPLNVGLPILAFRRLPEGAAAYGGLMSAMGGGALLGMIAVIAAPRPRANVLGSVVLSALALIGIGLASLAFVTSTAIAAALAGIVGIGLGYGNLSLSTWAQQRIPKELLGRVFSLMLLGSVALVPISQMIAGLLVAVSLEAMFVGGGGAMALLALVAATTTTVRGMGVEPAREFAAMA